MHALLGGVVELGERYELEITLLGIGEVQTARAQVGQAVVALVDGQDAAQDLAHQRSGVLGNELRGKADAKGEDRHLPGAGDCHVQQARRLLIVEQPVLALHVRKGLGRALGHLVRDIVLIELRHREHIRIVGKVKAVGQRRPIGAPLALDRLQRVAVIRDAVALRHGDHGELQALGRMHRHDAHGVLVGAVERRRRFLDMGDVALVRARHQTRGERVAGALALHDVERLEHVGGDGAVLRLAAALQPEQPSRLVHHVAHDIRHAVVADASHGAPEHLASTREQRQLAEFLHDLTGEEHLAGERPRVDDARLRVDVRRQGEQLRGTQAEHGRGEQRHQALLPVVRIGQEGE